MSASGNSAVVSPLAFLPSLGHMGQRLQHVKMLLDSPNEDSSAAISNRAQRILLKVFMPMPSPRLLRLTPHVELRQRTRKCSIFNR